VSATLQREVLTRYFAALRRADEALRADPDRFLPLWERNVPPALRGRDCDIQRFGPGELLVVERYSEDEFEGTVGFAGKRGLDGEMVETR